MKLPVTGPSYIHSAQSANYQRCVNYFVTEAGRGGRTGGEYGQVAYGPLLPTSGILSKLSLGSNAIRQLDVFGDFAYAVHSNTVYKLTVDETAGTVTSTSLGTLTTSTGRVYAAYNGDQIIWVDGSTTGTIYNLNNYVAITIGPIGGTAGDTYNLTLNGTAVYTAQNVATALTGTALAAKINTLTGTHGITATYVAGLLTLSVVGTTTITCTESGTGWTAGTDGITITGYDLATGSAAAFRTIVDSGFVGGGKVLHVDGYFVYFAPNTSNVYASQLLDGTNWDPLDIFAATGDPDDVISLAYAKGDLWVFGPKSIEIWYDAGNVSGSPLSKRTGFDITIGCGAAESVVVVNDVVIWLDSRGYVVQSDVSPLLRSTSSTYQLKVISNEYINAEIATLSTKTDATACTFVDRGHVFYQLTFMAASKTYVYDMTTGEWHTRTTFRTDTVGGITSEGEYKHLIQFTAQSGTKTLAASASSDGKIYFMSHNYLDDNGTAIRRTRTTAPLNEESKLFSVDNLVLRVESGLAPQSTDFNMSMRYSTNGGHTWSNPIPRSAGLVGEYGKFINWMRLGYGREWVFEFTTADSVNHAIISGSIDSTELEI